MERSVRVVVFISQQKDFEEEINKLYNSALGLNSRLELRIAKVVKPDIVMNFKKKMGDIFFKNNTSNAIVLLKHNKSSKSDIKIYASDISSKSINYFNWINERSLEPIEEMNTFTFKIINMIRRPFFIAFLSNVTNAASFKSDTLLSSLTKITSEDPSLQVLYTYNDFYKSKKKMFGIAWDAEPSISFVFGSSQNQSIPFEQNKEMSAKNIKEYVSQIVDGSLIEKYQQKLRESLPKPKTFEDMWLEKGVDVLLFLFDSSIKPRETGEIGMNFSKAAYRFKELKIK